MVAAIANHTSPVTYLHIQYVHITNTMIAPSSAMDLDISMCLWPIFLMGLCALTGYLFYLVGTQLRHMARHQMQELYIVAFLDTSKEVRKWSLEARRWFSEVGRRDLSRIKESNKKLSNTITNNKIGELIGTVSLLIQKIESKSTPGNRIKIEKSQVECGPEGIA